MSSALTKREMKDYIPSFRRKLREKDSECYSIINRKTKIIGGIDDRDLYVNFLGCLICQTQYRCYLSLFTHMAMNHPEYRFNRGEIKNPETNMQEGHIFATKTKQGIEDNDDRGYGIYYVRDKNLIWKHLIYLATTGDILYSPDVIDEEVRREKEEKSVTQITDKKVYKIYPDNEQNRVFFHSVSGEILNEGSDDTDYEIDEDDLKEFNERDIDQYTDICDSDKTFFKLWNSHVHTIQNKTFGNMPNILSEFVKLNYKQMIEKDLAENFTLHLINLHDHQQINREIMAEITTLFNSLNI